MEDTLIYFQIVRVEKENSNKIKEIRKNSATMFHFLDKKKLLEPWLYILFISSISTA